jgi:hypothetical protein
MNDNSSRAGIRGWAKTGTLIPDADLQKARSKPLNR